MKSQNHEENLLAHTHTFRKQPIPQLELSTLSWKWLPVCIPITV